ncbi:hypothetical protein HNR07_000254 [Nocardiopsis metallicus]|uniref:Uncharacterized protein n=1 Tax=Nocardiopsis metallicus TaxID=179819 RepID=A0A840WBI1_9ACTN|nr:hypothetical protein [Nocardiopsis metallicus]
MSDPLDVYAGLGADEEFLELMDIMAVFECQDSDHRGERGTGCAGYRRSVDGTRGPLAVFENIHHPPLR